MNYADARLRNDDLQRHAAEAGTRLRALPGVGAGPMGLTPDAVKASPEYRDLRAAYERAVALARDFAATMARSFPAEMRAARYGVAARRSGIDRHEADAVFVRSLRAQPGRTDDLLAAWKTGWLAEDAKRAGAERAALG